MENQNEKIQPVEEQKKKKPSTGLKITVLVILIVLLAVGILLPIKLVPNAVSSIASSISSFFVGKQEVKLTVDKSEINTGESFTLNWDGKLQTDGTYSLTYECTTGVRVETSINQPNETIACGTPFYFSPTQNSVTLTPFSEANRYSDVKLSLGFLENGASTIDALGETNVTVTNTNIPELNSATTTPDTTVTEEPSQPATPSDEEPEDSEEPAVSTPVSNPNGMADLEVRPIATGYLDAQGNFVPSGSVAPHQQAVVKFAIVNVGDKNTGTWNFTVAIPSQTDPRFDSGTQQNLGPGDRIEYTLGFNNINNSASNIVTITADASNYVTERSKANNTARMYVVNTQGTGAVTGTGKADLVVRILDTGVINRSNNSYTQSTTANAGDRVGVRIEIENIGTVASGGWRFQASLPTADSNNSNFNSENYQSLNPGQKITLTVGFESLRNQGSNLISVFVDSSAQVSESNESNNNASATITRN
jgi:hypothetical protein